MLWNGFVIFKYITFQQQVMFIAVTICEKNGQKIELPLILPLYALKIFVEFREIAGCLKIFLQFEIVKIRI